MTGEKQSQSYQRLRQYIAERMRMIHIYQPLMLLELLGRRSPAPAPNRGPADPRRRRDPDRLLHAARQADGGQGAHGNGITEYGNGAYRLIGGEELSDAERDELQQLWPPAP